MADDNTLIIVATQTEGDRVLSRLTLEYPGMDNTNANVINLAFSWALLDKATELAKLKAAAVTMEPLGQAKKT